MPARVSTRATSTPRNDPPTSSVTHSRVNVSSTVSTRSLLPSASGSLQPQAEPFLSIQPVGTLGVYEPAFPTEQHLHTAIPVAHAGRLDLLDSLAQRRLSSLRLGAGVTPTYALDRRFHPAATAAPPPPVPPAPGSAPRLGRTSQRPRHP